MRLINKLNVNIEDKKITIMQQRATYNHEAMKGHLDADQMPTVKAMVKAISLAEASEKQVAGNYAGLLVKYEGKNYLMSQQALVPSTAQLVRDSQESLVGIPAVVGGSL